MLNQPPPPRVVLRCRTWIMTITWGWGFPAGRYGWKPWKMICIYIYKYVKNWIYIYTYNIIYIYVYMKPGRGGTKTLCVVLEVWGFEHRFFLATLEFNHILKTLGTVFLFDYLCQWSGSSITLKKSVMDLYTSACRWYIELGGVLRREIRVNTNNTWCDGVPKELEGLLLWYTPKRLQNTSRY